MIENNVITNPEVMVFRSTREEIKWLVSEAKRIRERREELEEELGLTNKQWNSLMGRYE